jgi:thiol-disulfide isomerase/thioredoxin
MWEEFRSSVDVVPATPAPEFANIEGWLNTEPLSIKSLKGKVVLLDCWTYTCVFCLRTVPIMRRLMEKYGKHGLVVVGAHSAEYEFATNVDNVKRAVERYRVNIPVALDTKNYVWEAYGNTYWPRHVLIDSTGLIRYEHAGYGVMQEFEEPVVELLQEAGQDVTLEKEDNPEDEIYELHGMHFEGISPEVCLGYTRLAHFGNTHNAEPNKLNQFKHSGERLEGMVYLNGSWFWDRECVRYGGKENSGASIVMKYNARRVSTIVGTADGKPARMEVKLDGNCMMKDNAGRDVTVQDGKSYVDVAWNFMHSIVRTEEPEMHEVEIIPKTNNFVFYTFVFG